LKNLIGNTLKVGIPLAFGIYIIWYQYDKLDSEQVEAIKQSFRDANYLFVLLSIFFGTLSHLSRAYRWRYTLEPLGIKIKFSNAFFSVMIAYVANIVFPRLGEVSRCAVIAKYEDQPFEKLFGTVVAERVADMLILLSIIAIVLFLQIDILKDTLQDMLVKGGDSKQLIWKLAAMGIGAVVIGISGFAFMRKSNHAIVLKVKNLIGGLMDGIMSISRMDKKWAFIGHTAFIWFMYLAMFYVVFFALPETSNVPVAGVLASFVVGGLSIVLVQGGIGVYPLFVSIVLQLYGLTETAGLTLGWIIWTGQTFMILGWGAFSLIAMPLMNDIPKKAG
jgi:hypothetical protein